MALYDSLDGERRARIVVSLDDPDRTHGNFLPESGRRRNPLRNVDREQRCLIQIDFTSEATSFRGTVRVPAMSGRQ